MGRYWRVDRHYGPGNEVDMSDSKESILPMLGTVWMTIDRLRETGEIWKIKG